METLLDFLSGRDHDGLRSSPASSSCASGSGPAKACSSPSPRAFWLLGLAQALLTFTDIPVEERSWLFLLRLAAFSLILVSIWKKNRRG